LARATYQTSLTGHILDSYGAHLNALGLQIGLGFYVAQKASVISFFYLVPFIPFFYAARLTTFCYRSLFQSINNENLNKSMSAHDEILTKNKEQNGYENNGWRRYLWITRILDDRARSVDFILMIILIEIIFPNIFLTWIIFLLLVIKGFIVFSGTLYLVAKKGWAENTFEVKLREINIDNS
jgi:hypothetical protein